MTLIYIDFATITIIYQKRKVKEPNYLTITIYFSHPRAIFIKSINEYIATPSIFK